MNEEEKEAIEKVINFAQFYVDEYGKAKDNKYIKILKNLIENQQKEIEQVKKFGIPIETLCAEFERLENLEDKTDELKMELEDKQKEIEYQKELYEKLLNGYNERVKEIEELKVLEDDINNKNIAYIDEPEFEEKFISKDKIREKIKHYNNELEHIKNGEEFENEEPMYYWGKVALEDLLEEE